jgi:hypothetical protein
VAPRLELVGGKDATNGFSRDMLNNSLLR